MKTNHRLLFFWSLTIICWAEQFPIIQPFKIHIGDADLEDLKIRLGRAILPSPRQEAGWDYGMNLTYFSDLVNYWKTDYDWKTQEIFLNSFPQFLTEVDGYKIHFIHYRSSNPEAIPLIISHGWPGSFYECTKAIKLLAESTTSNLTFHVVCPSLPGFGFSTSPNTKGSQRVDTIAKVFAKLMKQLNYEKYIAQGGDWGSFISQFIAHHDPVHCVGAHVNMVTPPQRTSIWFQTKLAFRFLFANWLYTPEDAAKLGRLMSSYTWHQFGYFHLQATKPDTVGVALSDSPVGLAAYIVEKFHGWSDCKGNLENSFTKDDLLNNVMIYWWTQTITSSMRTYYDNAEKLLLEFNDEFTFPLGAAVFPAELFLFPRNMLDDTLNIVHYTEMPRGGHFALLEEPELMAEDIRSFAKVVWNRSALKTEL